MLCCYSTVASHWPCHLTDPKSPKVEESSSMRLSSDRRPITLRLAAGHSPVVHSILTRSSSFSGPSEVRQLWNPFNILSPVTNFNHPRNWLPHLNDMHIKLLLSPPVLSSFDSPFFFLILMKITDRVIIFLSSVYTMLSSYLINTNIFIIWWQNVIMLIYIITIRASLCDQRVDTRTDMWWCDRRYLYGRDPIPWNCDRCDVSGTENWESLDPLS